VGKKRRIELTVETSQTVVMRRTKRPFKDWCGKCSAQVCLVTPEQAAAASGVSARLIYRWIEIDRIPFTEMADGSIFICLNSIANEKAGLPDK
jgi:hypothetical protein